MSRNYRVLYWLCLAISLGYLLYLLFFPESKIAKLNEKIKDYEYVGQFNEGLAVVKKEGKIGFVDKSGELVIPFKWDYKGDWRIGEVMFANGQCLIPSAGDGKEHLIDKEGNEISSKEDTNDTFVRTTNWSYNDFEESREFYCTFENLCGGNVVGEEELKEKYGYEFIRSMHCSNDGVGLATLLNTKTNKYGIVDVKGNIVVPFEYDNNICFCYGLLVEVFSVSRDSDCGLQTYGVYCNVYKEGRLLQEKIPYFDTRLTSMGFFLFPYYGDDWCEMVKTELDFEIPASVKATKLLDVDGKEVSRIPFGPNFLRLSEDVNYWFLEDKDGELVFPKKFRIHSRHLNFVEIETEEGLNSLCLSDDGWCVICDYRGYLIAGIIQMMDNFPRTSYPLCTYKKELSDDDNYLNCHYAKVGDWRRIVNAIQPNGGKLLPYDVDEVNYFSDGLLRLRVGKRYFFVDKDGNGMIER